MLDFWKRKTLPAPVAAAAHNPLTQATALPRSRPAGAEPGLLILASAVRTAHGQSAAELAQLFAAGQTELNLDSELVDELGFPIFSGRVHSIDIEPTRAALDELPEAAASAESASVLQWTHADLRGLTLAGEAVRELADVLASHAALAELLNSDFTPDRSLPKAELPLLQLLINWPAHWSVLQQRQAGGWLTRLIMESGWPSEKIACEDLDDQSASSPLQKMTSWINRADSSARAPALCLLLAFDSALCQSLISQSEQQQRLFKPHDARSFAQGQVPAEGAAALLFADSAQAACFETVQPVSMRLITANDFYTAVEPAVETDLLNRLAEAASNQAVAQGQTIKYVSSDFDRRPDSSARWARLMTQCFPALDLQADCVAIAAHSGLTGAVASLTALALAHYVALQEKPGLTMCIDNNASVAPCAALLQIFKFAEPVPHSA